MALDATVGGASSNSYGTVAEGDTYFGDRLYASEWTSATPENKAKALVTFCRRMEEESYLGVKADPDQALKFPRVGVYDEDGSLLASDAIPSIVKQAQFMGALELLKADFLAENYLHNYSFLSTGTMQFKQFTQQSAGRLPSESIRLLRFLMTSAGGGRIVRA